MRYDLSAGLDEAIKLIDQLRISYSRVVVAVSGGSASGKTTQVARRLRDHYGHDAVMISHDDYYIGAKRMAELAVAGQALTWDDPGAIDLPLVFEHQRQLLNGQPIDKPVYSKSVSERVGTERVYPAPVIIFEGILASHETFLAIPAVKIFVDIGFHGRVMRRLKRDMALPSMTLSQIFEYLATVVEDKHREFVQRQMDIADLIIMNEYNPAVEAWQDGMLTQQWKYWGHPNPKQLETAQARYLGRVWQSDTYYSPFDRDLTATDEMVRIRCETEHPNDDTTYILAYKGPRRPDQPGKRPLIEFPITQSVAGHFIQRYGQPKRIIEKVRVFYSLPGAIVSLDLMVRGVFSKRGDLTEIRVLDPHTAPADVAKLAESLGFNPEHGITTSYLEME